MIFSNSFLGELVAAADRSTRRRQHFNVHGSHQEVCQRLFNAIGTNSYIRPHRHALDPKSECLVAVRGSMALIMFDDVGQVTDIVRLCTECYNGAANSSVGLEIPPGRWHTVIAETPGAILFEVKAGPFDPARSKEWAPWAPEEGTVAAGRYLAELHRSVKDRLGVPSPSGSVGYNYKLSTGAAPADTA